MAKLENDFLSQLVLWRNDPIHAKRVREKAEAGNVHAQYALGLM